MFRRIVLTVTLLLIAPIVLQAQSADSLRLLWRNEAISGVTAHAFSHSGKVLALANEHEIGLWDLKAGGLIKTFSIPRDNYEQMAFTSSDDEIVMLSHPGFERGVAWCGNGTIPEPPFGNEMRLNVNSGRCETIAAASRKTGEWALSQDGNYTAVITDSACLVVYASQPYTLVASEQLGHHKGYMQPNILFTDKWLAVTWGDTLTLRDIKSLEIKAAFASKLGWRLSDITNESIFIPYESSSNSSQLFNRSKGEFILRPTPTEETWEYDPVAIPKDQTPADEMLFGQGKYLVVRFEGRNVNSQINYSTGFDSLVICDTGHPKEVWTQLVSRTMKIMDQMPDGENLLLSDGNIFMTLNARTGDIGYLDVGKRELVGFGNTDKVLLSSQYYGLQALDENTGKIKWSVNTLCKNPFHVSPDGEMVTQIQNDKTIEFIDMRGERHVAQKDLDGYPLFWNFLNNDLLLANNKLYQLPTMCCERRLPWLIGNDHFIPASENTLLWYGKGDTAQIYDLRNGVTTGSFVGGLNHGIGSAAISPDGKWLVTVRLPGAVRLWRVVDGALVKSFDLEKPSSNYWYSDLIVKFTPNDKFLIVEFGGQLQSVELATGKSRVLASNDGSVSTFCINSNCTLLATGGPEGGTRMYQIPDYWRNNDSTFDPKTVYLPLRFYLPADAPDAVDSNGTKFSPPRTHVKLELRYADGRLLEKILDGPFHKGKWHVWEYEMTKYPKGTYIMHTEIGGVVKDEKMEVR